VSDPSHKALIAKARGAKAKAQKTASARTPCDGCNGKTDPDEPCQACSVAVEETTCLRT